MKAHLIAECGVNWNTMTDAAQMIVEAKAAGSDYVKFQLFNKETIKDSPLKERLKPLILDETGVKILKSLADANKIGLILTPMYLEAVDIAAKYADFIKIRYRDNANQPLIDKALETRKPLLVSVDSRPLNAHHPRIYYLYCIASYPPRPEDVTLEFACTCEGFSSHFPHTTIDLAYAVRCFHDEFFIEKHVMLSTQQIGITATYTDGSTERVASADIVNHPIDEAVSITFEQLAELRKQLDIISKIRRLIF